MIHAHIMNITDQGSYEKELNATLSANNRPCFKIPNTSNSNLPIKILTQEEGASAEPGQATKSAQVNAKSSNATEAATPSTKQADSKSKLIGKDIQLKIYTPESSEWPEHTTSRDLAGRMKENKVKFTYCDQALKEKEIVDLVESNIKLDSSCWKIAEESVFKKIRSGHIADQTLPPKDIHRKTSKKTLI